MSSQYKIKQIGHSYILYDADIITAPSLRLFDADYHTNNAAQQNNSPPNSKVGSDVESEGGVGRARVVYFLHNNITMVLKHYYRGGAVASLVKDHYFGLNIEKTRSFREWRLLKKMHSLNLPVPDAVAAHVKKGLFSYQADLITQKIEDTKTLSDVLSADSLSPDQWQKIGYCIKSFHQHSIYHADLNARNILLNEKGDVFLIDFDNSYIRSGTGFWKLANLSRLKRSLLKFKKNESVFYFDEKSWTALINGYQ